MGLFKTSQSIDNPLSYVDYNPFNFTTQAEGIDLRVETHTILYGNGVVRPKGHWIVLRHFDRTSQSVYWKEQTKEGVGGPAYNFTNTLLRTRKVPIGMRSDTIDVLKAGATSINPCIYYFEYTVTLQIGDFIFELDIANHATTPTYSENNFTEKYIIKRVHPYRLENGNVQYLSIFAEQDQVTYG